MLGERQSQVELESDLFGDDVELIVDMGPSESQQIHVQVSDRVNGDSIVMVIGPSHDDGFSILGPFMGVGGVE